MNEYHMQMIAALLQNAGVNATLFGEGGCKERYKWQGCIYRFKDNAPQ